MKKIIYYLIRGNILFYSKVRFIRFPQYSSYKKCDLFSHETGSVIQNTFHYPLIF